jgi:hypothetical protein
LADLARCRLGTLGPDAVGVRGPIVRDRLVR